MRSLLLKAILDLQRPESSDTSRSIINLSWFSGKPFYFRLSQVVTGSRLFKLVVGTRHGVFLQKKNVFALTIYASRTRLKTEESILTLSLSFS